jgi:hypothetical protein
MDLPDLLLEESDEVQNIAGGDLGDDADESETRTGDDAIALLTSDRPRTRYLHLFHLAKQIAQKGSIPSARYGELSRTLTNILEGLAEANDGEIRNAVGRARGRPRRMWNSRPPRKRPPSLFAAIFMRYSDTSFAKRFRTRKFTTLVSCRGIVIENSADMLAIEKTRLLSWQTSVAEHQAKTEVPKKACHS